MDGNGKHILQENVGKPQDLQEIYKWIQMVGFLHHFVGLHEGFHTRATSLANQ